MDHQQVNLDARVSYHQAIAGTASQRHLSAIADYLHARCPHVDRLTVFDAATQELSAALNAGTGADEFFRTLDARAVLLAGDNG